MTSLGYDFKGRLTTVSIDKANMPGTTTIAYNAFGTLLRSRMRQVDAAHVDKGERSMIAGLSSDGFLDVRTIVISYCREHPTETIYAAAHAMYEGVRGVQSSMGVR